MNIHHRPTRLAAPSAVTIGNFDGVHLGHAAVLNQLVRLAKQHQLVPTVVTFAPNPKTYFAHLRAASAPAQIMPLRDKVLAMKQLGVERVVVVPFDTRLANMPAEQFVADVLHTQLNTRWLMVGDDFRFGAQRCGDFAFLHALRGQFGYELDCLHSIEHEQTRISSSAIREYIHRGDMVSARALLGHELTVSGHIIYGKQLGRTIGAPTINIKMPAQLASQGIYAVQVRLSGCPQQVFQGAASIGVRPSVDSNGQCWCEVHLLDFAADVYGQVACVSVQHKIRDEEKFNDLTSLVAAIEQDIAQCRAYFAG